MLPAVIFLTLALSSQTIAQSICNRASYTALLCLTSNTNAAALCTAATATSTHTSTTTTISWITSTKSSDATSQVTLNQTEVSTILQGITVEASGTVTHTAVHTSAFSTTLTAYTSTCTDEASQAPDRRNRIRQNAVCDSSGALSALSSLSSLADGLLGTACECLSLPVKTTTTITTTATVAAPSVTTLFMGLEPTTTNIFLSGLTMETTVIQPATTISVHTTTSVTSTATISLPSPTFTQVFGPEAGCEDTGADDAAARQLDKSIADAKNATQECMNLCAQMPECGHVFVQHMDCEENTVHYACLFNVKPLNVTADLECGKPWEIWGTASGYDVVETMSTKTGDDDEDQPA